MKICLDTNIVIDILRGNRETKEKINKLNRERFYTNPIIISELFKGAYGTNNPQEHITEVEDILLSLEVLPFNQEVCKIYGKIYQDLKKIGKPTNEFDLMIGCISLANNATLITRNPKDFANIKGLKIIGW